MLRTTNKLFCLLSFIILSISSKANNAKYNRHTHTRYTDTTLNSTYSGSNYGPVYTNTLFGKDSALLPNAQLRTIDQNYQAYQTYIVKTHKIKNLITFSIDEESQYMIQSDFAASIFLDVYVTKAQGSEPAHFKKSLSVNYKQNPDSPYQAMNYYPFEDGVDVVVTVDSILIDSTGWDVTRVLKLKNDIQAQRDMVFDCHVVDNTAYYLEINNTHVNDFGEITVNCFHPVTNFPNEYDIEWAWMDKSADDTNRQPQYIYKIFDNNASRITKKTPTYNVPLLYDGEGKIYVRYRCVQQLPSGQRLEGDWVYNIQSYSTPASYSFNGHEPNLNWQATTSFAEDGKRKSVIQYFDGSLRGRQTVTKDNQTNTTIVAETFYDFQGRPVIQVLPAPTLSNIIAFTKNFNQFNDNTRTGKDIYDQLNSTENVCSKLTAELKKTSGASFYYSANWVNTTYNTNNIGEFDKFIPDADGRPYTETRYTNDGTGRIDAQGGVGTTHQINNGHDTKYLYESPNQSELDALFGTDAGLASHYFKNWVKDANGQYSVSYVDMHGRTVATSLAGSAPGNLQPLESEAAAAITKKDQLIDAETNTIDGKKIVSSKSLVVPIAKNYTFNYNVQTPQVAIANCTPGSPANNYTPVYDVKISIVPDCQNKLTGVNLFQLTPIFPNCTITKTTASVQAYYPKYNLSGSYSTNGLNIFATLPEGSFTIIKELIINEEEFQKSKQLYVSQNICKSLQSFKDEQYTLSLAQSNCGATCATCSTRLGSFDDFKNKIIHDANLNATDVNADAAMLAEITSAYSKAKENCDKLCNQNEPDGLDELRGIEQSMLNDVTPPYGQYAQTDKPNGKYSIFSSSYWSLTPYQKPVTHNIPTGGGAGTYDKAKYKDENNIEANPQPDITDITKFTGDFKHSYAKQLLPYHPEYCKLITAKTKLIDAYKFEAKLNKINTWADAVAVFSGKLTQTSLGGIETVDPFFSSYGNLTYNYLEPVSGAVQTFPNPNNGNAAYTYKQLVIQKIYTEYQKTKLSNNSTELSLSMWKLAQMPITCRTALLALQSSPNSSALQHDVDVCLATTLPGASLSSMGACSGDLDMIWKNFKSFYLSYRRKLINDFLNDNSNLICPYTNALQTNKQINDASGTPRFVEFGTNGEKTGVKAYDDIIAGFADASTSAATKDAQLKQAAKSTCETNIENWKNWLLECKAITSYSQVSHSTIINGQSKIVTWNDELTYLLGSMSIICQNGFGLLDHPLGASSIKPSLNRTIYSEVDPMTGAKKLFNSIPQLLEDFFHTRFASNYAYTELCHPYLITAPPPYENSTSLINQYVITKPSDCECNRLKALKGIWQNQYSGITFSEYLKFIHGTIISEARLDTLSKLCDGTLNGCTFLPYAIDLPPVLQCKNPDSSYTSLNTCISCSEYNTFKNEFTSMMPPNSLLSQVPYKMPKDDNELNANIAFAKFINYKTGFTKNWQEYADFGNKCSGNINCTILEQLLNAYYQTSTYQQNQTGNNCKTAFVSYMNQALDVAYTYEQWMQFFMIACGRTPDVCLERVNCDTIKKYAYEFYNTNSLTTYKNINCSSIFATYFSNKLGKPYTYQQITQIAQQLNCCESDFCSFPNTTLFGVVYKRFITQYSTTLWSGNKADCEALFTDYFNGMLGLQEIHDGVPTNTWSWDMIRSYYLEHTCTNVNILNLCSPPFGCDQLKDFLDNNRDIFSSETNDCEQQFENAFNSQFSTHFIFAEIKDLYLQMCDKIELPNCNSVFNCDLLAESLANFNLHNYPNLSCKDAFVYYFNHRYTTNYTFDEISSIYTHSKCVDRFDPCATGGPSVTDCKKLEAFIKEFNEKFPNAAEEYRSNCSKFFLDYFCNYFNVAVGSYTVNDVVNMLNNCHIKFKLPCSDNSKRIADFINSYSETYSQLQIPVYGKKELFRFMYNKEFYENPDDGLGFSQIYEICTDPDFLYSYSQGGYNAENPCQTPNSIQCTMYKLLQSDETINPDNEDALYDLKIAYYLMHPIGFAEDCQYDFANYYNLNFDVQLSVEQVAEHYENILGEGASAICPGSGGEGSGGYVVTEGHASATVQLNYLLCGNNVPLFNNNPIVTPPCGENLDSIAWAAAENKYELYVQDQIAGFETQFIGKALAQSQLAETFTKTYKSSEHHFTLYFYDQVGNLVKTVPPAGVDNLSSYTSTRTSTQYAPTTGREAFVFDVQQARANAITNGCSTNNKLQPPHTLITQYRYNTLNQVVEQNTPDAGTSKFWYDRLGRLVVSQNAKQAITKTSNHTGSNYSYTLYDELGRVSEFGQLPHTFAITNDIAKNPANLTAWMHRTIYTPISGSSINYGLNNNDKINQVTRTEYDLSYYKGGLGGVNLGSLLKQKNLRNRVSYDVLYNELEQVGTDATYDCVNAATYYSYDIHGNVDELVQDFGKSSSCVGTANSMNAVQRHKKIEYNYDLISGKVNSVSYQAGQIDAFYHRYNYDAENQLISMETSRDAIVWQKDASYGYYKHGALARTVLGDQQVQGIDYAYTLQGWLKGVNSTTDGGSFDMGHDGKINTNSVVARDAFGFSLNYYNNDYIPISITAPQAFAAIPMLPQVGDAVAVGKDLFNGNIASITLNIPKLGNTKVYGYSYDQLNRLLAMNIYEGLNGNSNTFNTPQGIDDYKERLSYDANGNIRTYFRNGSGANLALNNYSYTYINGSNRLNTIANSVNTTTYQYQHDEVGNITQDEKQNVSNAVWNIYGKLQSVEKTDGTHISYTYNTIGQRISKTVEPATGEAYTEYYVKDATGNTLATYKKQASLNGNHLTLSELNKYGSSLVGRLNLSVDIEGSEVITELPIDIGIGKGRIIRNQTEYYLYNHLGSPITTISDRKIAHSSNGTTIDYYIAVVLTASYYSAYGAISKEYNYSNITLGHNGQKLSKEISPTAQTALFWEYDADIARRWNIDPANSENSSPYSVFSLNPINFSDIHGDSPSIKEAAEMSVDCYNKFKDRIKISGGWERIESFKGVKMDGGPTNGFQAALYSRTGANGVTEYCWATAGTASLTDLASDVKQTYGMSRQYDFSWQQGKALSKLLYNSELTFVGHSLGGGMAALNALANNKKATTFNAAGLSFLTNEIYGVRNKSAKKITAFRVDGEIVGPLQGVVGIKVDGKITVLRPPITRLDAYTTSPNSTISGLAVLARAVKLHLMASVKKSLEMAGLATFEKEEKVVKPPKRTYPNDNFQAADATFVPGKSISRF